LFGYRTFFQPAHLRRNRFQDKGECEVQLMSDLEAFWDAEVPRLGETASDGWTNWNRDRVDDSNALVPEVTGTVLRPSEESDPYKRWYQDEMATEKLYARPARALDLDDDDDDPYRTILFSDISPLLFVIQDPEVKLHFAFGALNVLGLPLVPPGVGSDAALFMDPHLSWTLDVNPPRLWPARRLDKGSTLAIEGGSVSARQLDAFTSPVKAWAIDDETACGDVQVWFANLDQNGVALCDLDFIG
jgi:hypothetical protein